MKIVAISDTHKDYGGLTIPKCDFLIHAGDIEVFHGIRDITNFIMWLKLQPAKYIIVIAGNHDIYIEQNNKFCRNLFEEDGIYYLENSGVKLEGINFWGSPVVPQFGDWAFMRARGKDIAKCWELIPENTDVLITHGPPKNILDNVYNRGLNVGCEELREKVLEIKPKYHIFGHIHEDGGKQEKIGKTTFVNASNLNENYELVHEPIILKI